MTKSNKVSRICILATDATILNNTEWRAWKKRKWCKKLIRLKSRKKRLLKRIERVKDGSSYTLIYLLSRLSRSRFIVRVGSGWSNLVREVVAESSRFRGPMRHHLGACQGSSSCPWPRPWSTWWLSRPRRRRQGWCWNRVLIKLF